MKIQTLIDYIEELIGHPINSDTKGGARYYSDETGKLIKVAPAPGSHDEGLCYGSSGLEIKRVVVCWMATLEAMEYAGETNADLILVHEGLFYPHNAVLEENEQLKSWSTNRRRLQLLEQYHLSVLRLHGSLDEIIILDEFAKTLRLGNPVDVESSPRCYEDIWARIYAIDPRPLSDLVEHVKNCTGMSAVRVVAPRGFEQVVERIGLPWGGMGLNGNIGYVEKLISMSCDVLICGEADNYMARYAADSGISVIETDHEVSENPGIARFSNMLQERFPELAVSFFECRRIWRTC